MCVCVYVCVIALHIVYVCYSIRCDAPTTFSGRPKIRTHIESDHMTLLNRYMNNYSTQTIFPYNQFTKSSTDMAIENESERAFSADSIDKSKNTLCVSFHNV